MAGFGLPASAPRLAQTIASEELLVIVAVTVLPVTDGVDMVTSPGAAPATGAVTPQAAAARAALASSLGMNVRTASDLGSPHGYAIECEPLNTGAGQFDEDRL